MFLEFPQHLMEPGKLLQNPHEPPAVARYFWAGFHSFFRAQQFTRALPPEGLDDLATLASPVASITPYRPSQFVLQEFMNLCPFPVGRPHGLRRVWVQGFEHVWACALMGRNTGLDVLDLGVHFWPERKR